MDDKFCPLLNGSCIKDKCKWYIGLTKVNLITKQEDTTYECSMSLIPKLVKERTVIVESTETQMNGFKLDMMTFYTNYLHRVVNDIRCTTEKIIDM